MGSSGITIHSDCLVPVKYSNIKNNFNITHAIAFEGCPENLQP